MSNVTIQQVIDHLKGFDPDDIVAFDLKAEESMIKKGASRAAIVNLKDELDYLFGLNRSMKE